MSVRTALLIGGLGYIGCRLGRTLVDRGWRVSILDLREPGSGTPYTLIRGDRNDGEAFGRVAAEGYDAVFDLVAYDGAATTIAIDALAGRIDRFVHLSTISVYATLGRSPASEADATLVSPTGTTYAAGKVRCEQLLVDAFAARAFPAVIVRSAPVFGPDDPVSRERYFFERLTRRRPILHPGPLSARALMLFVDDLVEGLIAAAERPNVAGSAFHLAQEDCPTLAEHVKRIADLAGTAPPCWSIRSVPELVQRGFRIAAFPYPLGPAETLAIGAARKALHFAPISYADALELTVRALVDQTEGPCWPGRGSTQAKLCGTHQWLHADQEREQDVQPTPLPGLSISEVLCLLEENRAGIELISTEQYEALRDSDPTAWSAGSSIVVAPQDLIDRMPTPERRNVRPSVESRLAAVIVPVAGSLDTFELCLRPAPNPEQEYGHRHPFVKLRIRRFHELDLTSPAADDIVLATIDRQKEASAFSDWLLACRARRVIVMNDVAHFARVFIPGRLTHGGVGTGWSAAFAIARALTALEAPVAEGALHLRIACAGSSLFGEARASVDAPLLPLHHPWSLCAVADRFLLIDVNVPRIFELPPVLAIIADVALSVSGFEAAARELHELLRIPFDQAQRTLETGLQQLGPIYSPIGRPSPAKSFASPMSAT